MKDSKGRNSIEIDEGGRENKPRMNGFWLEVPEGWHVLHQGKGQRCRKR